MSSDLVSTAGRYLYPNYRQPDVVLSHGRGVELFDTDGRRYLDFYAGIAVSTLGHAHPALVSALAEQAARVIHLSNYFYNEPNIRLAEKLCALTRMDRAFFCNSGTEAMEAMLKLSRRHFFDAGQPDRYRVVAFDNSFHGRTLGALAVTGQKKYREGFGPLPGVTHVPFGDLAAVEAAMGDDVAAILVEPIQGEGGVVPAPAGFLRGLRAIADGCGALLLCDEIQTGVGRTGRFLGAEHDDVRPDALVLAKGLAGGVPIGAMLCQGSLAGALPPGSHGSTFGGSPLASAAALAVLGALETDGLVENARVLGEHLTLRLGELATEHPKSVKLSRGRGLLQALVLDDAVDARSVMIALRERGLLVTLAGGQGLRISPPLVITKSELDEGLGLIDSVLAAST